ncbi:dephospho-CoA kinase [Thermocrinis albus DSM 14484]|uniref:Dephospho-CoA kinase n=1 Tax=Thermocrinis albus (strain DSM 14484 / JCM 11386 / HI 11/12) TaxID=638303 RepID=D3SND4_THEAH|nr:dephospho-CoA kinase [Thermocrinis albus]ADC88671.1 dephospho-CoA kinase [Thermocrinis albus DSM 14484]
MLTVGLTGNIGSGKSTVATLFRECGFKVYDADTIIKSFYQERGEVYRKVVSAFGESILKEDGSVDTKKLADEVFAHKEKLRILEEITHTALYSYLQQEERKLSPGDVMVVEASLLVEKGSYRRYHFLVVVYADYATCKERAIRKGFTEEDFERRWRMQMPPEEKLKKAHYIIDNRGDLDSLRRRVRELCDVLSFYAKFSPDPT